ncbi:MAG TPA: hypothetical protein VII48_07590 [Rhizomicrobium sp.]
MELFRYATSVYGNQVLLGASFDLLQWFVAVGVAAILAHAIFKFVVPSPHNAGP